MKAKWLRKPFYDAANSSLRQQGGSRLATSVNGVLTGRGPDIIIIDDPLKPNDAMSDSRRNAANEWYDGTLYSRLNDKTKGTIVIIMQRLHENDLVGHVLLHEGWEVVSFPAIAEADENHIIQTPFGIKKFGRPRSLNARVRAKGKCPVRGEPSSS
ncbi:MAG: hypothetical protein WAN31_08130 [Methylovirgula sp.]